MKLSSLPKFDADKKLVRRFWLLWEEWKRAYPSIDHLNELQWAHAWLLSSGKQYRDMSRFLNNWMKSAQKRFLEKNPVKWCQPGKYHEEKPKDEDIMTGDDFKKMRDAIKKK